MRTKKEKKLICGVLRVRIPCKICNGMVWTQAYLNSQSGYTCNTCVEPKLPDAGRGNPHAKKITVLA